MRFFMIDRITSWKVGESAEAVKNISLSEDFFADHFPRHPVMPGVLILEGMAQLSGLLLEATLQRDYGKSAKALLVLLERTKFRGMARPGDTLTYRAELVSINETGGKAKVQGLRGESPVVTTEMVFAFQSIADPELDRTRDALLDLWLDTETGGHDAPS